MGLRDSTTPPQSRPASRRKIAFIALKVLVSSGLLYAVISKAGIDKVGATISGIDPLAFSLASMIYILSIYVSSIRWQLLLPEGFRLRKLFSLYLIGSFFNNILPGIIGGDAVKAYYLYRDTRKSSLSIASVFMDRYIGFAALMFLGLAAYPFGLRYFRGSYIEWVLPLIVLLFVTGSLMVLGLRIGNRFRLVSQFYDYLSLYKNQRITVLKTFVISLIVQMTNVSAVYIVSLGLKVDMPLLPLFVFIPIISTLATIPISISGLGVREASFVLLLGFLGISPMHATAVSFAWFLSIAIGSLPGLVEYLRYKRAA